MAAQPRALIGFDPRSVPGVDAALVETAIRDAGCSTEAAWLRCRLLPGRTGRR